MPVIKLSKIKVRRGSNEQRKRMVFDQGELVNTIDTQRLFVGTGTLSGGKVVGSKFHTPLTNYSSLSLVISEVGDIINVNNMTYQLTASNYSDVISWANVGTKLDPALFNYDTSNHVTLNLSSISMQYIAPSCASEGVKIESGFIKVNYNPNTMKVDGNVLTLAPGGISSGEISSGAFNNTLSGGNGIPIGNAIAFGPGLVFNSVLPSLDINPYAVNIQSSIYSSLTSVDPAITTFNGSMEGRLAAGTTRVAISALAYGTTGSTVLSDMFVEIVTLSSAGFITFVNPNNQTTEIGQPIVRFAIPIFTY